jgi:Outer membrane efflux protein
MGVRGVGRAPRRHGSQFKTASRLRAAAAQRLDAQRAFYNEGRITIDRFMDAVRQYASAVATEAQHKTGYNVSIVALEHAKGTLLEYDQITVVALPGSATPTVAGRDVAATLASQKPPRPSPAAAPPVLAAPAPLQPQAPPAIVPRARPDSSEPQAQDASPIADLAGKTFSFEMTVGIGSQPVKIRGSFTITPIRSVDAPKGH